jgi:hypothetical protein
MLDDITHQGASQTCTIVSITKKYANMSMSNYTAAAMHAPYFSALPDTTWFSSWRLVHTNVNYISYRAASSSSTKVSSSQGSQQSETSHSQEDTNKVTKLKSSISSTICTY